MKQVEFRQKEVKPRYEVLVGDKSFKIITNNWYIISLAMKEIEAAEREGGISGFTHTMKALEYIYGAEQLKEIGESDVVEDWTEFINFSISIATGMTPEEYYAEKEKAVEESADEKKSQEA